ncbi:MULTISPECIES: Spy/CpxP family protein refolding chaperone [Xenorhabdus]|nr:Spy/CpxP family protein refolding chaperone [Xenorhabdus sp. PB61.4]
MLISVQKFARIRNQMYQVLTPEQEKQFQRCYQARTTRYLY